VVFALLAFLLINITFIYASPSQNFIERDGEVYDDWGVCRTNAYGDNGYLRITPEYDPKTMYPIILEEGSGEYAELAWQKGLEFKAQYENIEERAEAILRYVQEKVEYKYDHENDQLPVKGYSEFARNADETMHSIIEEGVAYGDCEDHAILLATMYMAAGIRCAIIAMSNPFEGGHATVLVYLPGYNPGYPVHFFTLNGEWGWVMAEATGDSPLGYVSPDYMLYIENCMNYGLFLYYILEPNQTEQTSKARYITVGETYEFTLSEKGFDEFFVHLEENKIYNFSLTSITGEVNIKIYDYNNTLINESSKPGPDSVTIQASYTGYYKVYIHGDPQATFQIDVREVAKQEVTESRRITVGEEHQGYVHEGSSIIYIVELREGEIYRLTVTPQSGDPDVTVYNPWGIPIAESFELGLTHEVIDFTADITGDYVIEIYGYETSTFTLKIETLELSWNEIAIGETRQGHVDEGSSTFYIANLEPGEYIIVLEPLSGDPDLYVYDEWGYQIASSTNGEGEQDIVIIEVYEDATCIIEVYGYTTSEYQISIQKHITNIEEHQISVGEKVEGEVSQGASDIYYVELEAFSTYIVTLEPLNGDLDLYIYDPYGLLIAYSELPGITNEVIVITTIESGWYTIEVYGYESSRYTLSIKPGLSSIRPHGWAKMRSVTLTGILAFIVIISMLCMAHAQSSQQLQCYTEIETTPDITMTIVISGIRSGIPLEEDVFNETDIQLSTASILVETATASYSLNQGLTVVIGECDIDESKQRLSEIINHIEKWLNTTSLKLMDEQHVYKTHMYKFNVNLSEENTLKLLKQALNSTNYSHIINNLLSRREAKVLAIAFMTSKHYIPWYGKVVIEQKAVLKVKASGFFSSYNALHTLDFSDVFKVDKVKPFTTIIVKLPLEAEIKRVICNGSYTYNIDKENKEITIIYNSEAPTPSIEFTYQFAVQGVNIIFTKPDSTIVPKTFVVEVVVTSASRVQSVAFLLDGSLIVNKTSPPWRALFEDCSIGTHEVKVIAKTEAGFASSSMQVEVVSPPTIIVTSPSNNSVISGVVTIAIDVEGQVSRVDFYIDNKLIASKTSPPWHVTLDTSLESEGEHTITVKACNSYGESTSKIFVIIKRGGPPSKCIIATVAYGSELAPEVQLLRSFRDQYVASTFAGSCFLQVFNELYYPWSPMIAEYIHYNEPLKAVTRVLLRPLIFSLKIAYMAYPLPTFNPEVAVMTSGFIASFLIGLFYIAPILLITSAIGKAGAKLRKNLGKACKIMLIVVMVSLVLIAIAEYYLYSLLMMSAITIFVLSSVILGGLVTSLFVIKLIEKIVEASIGRDFFIKYFKS